MRIILSILFLLTALTACVDSQIKEKHAKEELIHCDVIGFYFKICRIREYKCILYDDLKEAGMWCENLTNKGSNDGIRNTEGR